jgi:TctA family transporter
MMEEYFRRALLIERGDPSVFFTRPISAVLLAIAAAMVVSLALPAISRARRRAVEESESA